MATEHLTDNALDVVRAYFGGHGDQYLADDVEFRFMASQETLRGREAVEQRLNVFYHEAFPGARAEDATLLGCEGNRVVAEWNFRGTNNGPLMGMPPTGKSVEVPMIAVYEVERGKIHRARVYFDWATFMHQLGLG